MTKVNKFLHHFAIFLGLRSAVDYGRLGKVLLSEKKDSPQQDNVRPQHLLYLHGEPEDEAQWAYGDGAPVNNVAAAKWWHKGAEQGNAFAQFYIGNMYYFGREQLDVPRDYAEAAKWIRKAAEQGHPFAENRLGVMYRYGEGMTKDYAEALKWWRKAVEQGIDKAQYNLGLMYYKGDGVPQDYAEAFKWYGQAADQGHLEAQYNLGYMYSHGEGVPQDMAKAVKWYHRAAEQGHHSAECSLDRILSQKEQDNLFRVPGLKSEERGHQVPPWSVHE